MAVSYSDVRGHLIGDIMAGASTSRCSQIAYINAQFMIDYSLCQARYQRYGLSRWGQTFKARQMSCEMGMLGIWLERGLGL